MSEVFRFDDGPATTHREIVDALQDFDGGKSLRVVTEERDVLARVDEDVVVREDVEVTDRIVEAQVTVYGDTRRDHVITSLSWWDPGPVMLAWRGNLERVERLEVR
jgi:hypothetical protein